MAMAGSVVMNDEGGNASTKSRLEDRCVKEWCATPESWNIGGAAAVGQFRFLIRLILDQLHHHQNQDLRERSQSQQQDCSRREK